MPPFARHVCFLILVVSVRIQESGFKSQDESCFLFLYSCLFQEPQQSSILLSSLLIYFFQYVKERSVSHWSLGHQSLPLQVLTFNF